MQLQCSIVVLACDPSFIYVCLLVDKVKLIVYYVYTLSNYWTFLQILSLYSQQTKTNVFIYISDVYDVCEIKCSRKTKHWHEDNYKI